jgi:7-cyano-7-deazaguanine synthase
MTNNPNKKAVILLSGGIDSATTAAIAKAEGYELYALSFDYAQRHRIELDYARKIAGSLGARKHMIMDFDLGNIGGSALTSEIEVPKGQQTSGTVPILREGTVPDLRTEQREVVESGLSPDFTIPITYVPARNTIFLSFALGWAEVLEAPDIFIGANAVDYSGYPDCRPEYLKAFEDMANLATKVSVEGNILFKINAPLLHMTKAAIIKKGSELGLDYALTWSCYDPQPVESQGNSELLPPNSSHLTAFIPCGRCDSCLIRARGFDEAGIADPL